MTIETAKIQNQSIDLRFIWLEITKKCNLTCTHCYADSSPNEELYGNMKYEDWISVIEQAAELGCREIQFIGGEPTMHPKLPDFIDFAKSKGFEFIEVFTNATRITKSLIDCFVRNDVRVATSFYSVDPMIHEEITKGEGSWYKTVEGIKTVLNAGLRLRVGVIETETNKEEARKALTFLKWLGVTQTSIDRERHVGRGDLVRLGEDEERYDELCGQCWKGKLCVTSEGIVYPCIFSRATQVGDVRSRFKDILKSDKLFLFQQKLQTLELQRKYSNNFFKCSPAYCSPSYCAPNVDCSPKYCAPGCHPGCDNKLIRVFFLLMGFVLSNAHIVKSDQVEIKSKRVVTHIEEQADATETWPARKIKGTLVDGQPDGDINSYSFDGKLMITEPQRMGKRHGVRVAYFPNGKVFSEEDFVNDMLHGESKQYYPNGKLRSVITFVRNKPHGEHIIYFENGNPIVKSFLILGKAQGKRFHYLKDGTHWGTTLWQDDQQVDQKVLVNPTDSDIQEMEQYANYPTALKSYWQDESETPIPARVK